MTTITTTGTAIMGKPQRLLGLCLLLIAPHVMAHMEDDPLLFMLSIDELEVRDAGDDSASWDVEAWLGRDLNKFRLRSEGERAEGTTESVETQALYSRAIAPYWDLQLGLRSDMEPGNGSGSGRDWAVLGIEGVAPYYFEIGAALFLGEDNRSALRLEAEYEILITQKLILSPEIEFNFHGEDDPELGIGSGLSDIEAGLRMRYEIRREFAPYIGVNREKAYGRTADLARTAGEDAQDSAVVLGIKAWF